MENKADTIRRLSEKWLESGNDSILDEINHLSKCVNNFQIPNRLILERYKEGNLSLHFHVRRVGVSGVESSQWCAIAKSPRAGRVSPFAVEGKVRFSVDGCGLNLIGGRDGQSQGLVFINIGESGEQPQRLIPTLVGLQTLDDCLRLCGDTAKTVTLELSDETVRAIAYRKHVGRAGDSFVVQDQLIDQVIERRAQVVQAVPDDDTYAQRRGGKMKDEARCISIRVSLGDDLALGIYEVPKNAGYEIEMFLCPDEFVPNTVERMVQ